MNQWIKLDNAANVFPSVAKSYNSAFYRIAMVLTEPVRPAILQKALNKTLRRYPLFSSRIRKGLFWRYMETGNQEILVRKEEDYPCYPLKNSLNEEQLIKVLYYNNRISFEVFHAVTDGNGAVEFLKTLVFEYLKLAGKMLQPEGLLSPAQERFNQQEAEDGFRRYYSKDKVPFRVQKKAYQITGTYFEPFGHNVIHGVISADQFKQLAKRHGTSITELLLAILVYMIYRESCLDSNNKKLPIKITVPVNLRRFFPTNSLRNFFATVNIEISSEKEQSLISILQQIKIQMKDNLQKTKMQEAINRNINFEKIIIARFIPLLVKDLIVRNLFFYYNDKLRTCTVSNLGRIQLPESMSSYVKRIELVFYPTLNNPINCGICSVNDELVITFARTIEENQIISNFFRYLTKEYGIEVKIYSNEWGICH